MKLKALYWNFRKPNSVSSALKQIVDPDEVSGLESQGFISGDLLEKLAQVKSYDEGSLLLAVANILDLAAVEGGFFPDPELMQKYSLTKEYLEPKLALLCKCRDVEALIVSELDQDLVKLAKKNKLQLCLGLVSQIRKSYGSFNFSTNSITTSQLEEVFKNIVSDASEIGASEISINSETGKYSFSVNGEFFEGSIHPKISAHALKWLEGKTKVKVKFEKDVYFTKLENEIIVNWSNKSNQILFVEDDKLFAKVLKSTLQKNSYQVDYYQDAESALVDLETGKIEPGMIISDLHLPGIDGQEFLSKVKKLKPNLPFLMLTSEEQELVEADLVNKGVGAYLKKNEDIRIILAWCNQLLSRYASN